MHITDIQRASPELHHRIQEKSEGLCVSALYTPDTCRAMIRDQLFQSASAAAKEEVSCTLTHEIATMMAEDSAFWGNDMEPFDQEVEGDALYQCIFESDWLTVGEAHL